MHETAKVCEVCETIHRCPVPPPLREMSEDAEKSYATLEEENAVLRKQVIKGRDIAKLLATRYSEKLQVVQQQHAEELAKLQERQVPDAAGLNELREHVADLEQAVTMYVGMAHGREKELNEQLASLSALKEEQARYIEELERREEELDARLVEMEGRVRGVVKEARDWNAREKELLGRLKEESLLVVHLTQREQQMLSEQRAWAARVERAEKKARELEEELLQVQQYHAAREKMADGDAGRRLSSTEDTMRPRGTTFSGVSSPVLSPTLSAHNSDKGTPPVPPRTSSSSSRRGPRSHQRSESLGVPVLQQLREMDPAMVSSHPTILINDAPPVVVAPSSGQVSPRSEQGYSLQHDPPPPIRVVEEVKASRGSHVSLRATAPNVSSNGSVRGSGRRKSLSKGEFESAAGQVAPPVAPGLAPLVAGEEGKESRRHKRGTRKMERPPSTEPMDGVSAEVLASVEAEIALLLKK